MAEDREFEDDWEEADGAAADEGSERHSSYKVPVEDSDERHLPGMFRNWFLDYASYTILSRAVPYLKDGLKPVQRRVLYAMRRAEDGRYNKVAGIVGDTMHFHPHGDSSIYGALVELGQKNLLIDCQGNWGNILTGDGAAAGRYIEARLTKFALEVVFNPKITEWKPSYDRRNQEPEYLPVKFPLVLALGAKQSMAVGLKSEIPPHNFVELCDASIAVLRGEEFHLYPDFQTGGMIDLSRYRDGLRGGPLEIRAHIEKEDNRTLKITDLPYGVTTEALMESIGDAGDKGKINVKKVEDNTSHSVEIRVYLDAKTSSDKTIDALYASTLCKVTYNPMCWVIDGDKPVMMSVSDILRSSTYNTRELLRKELEIEHGELSEQLLYASLEKIFIEERIYKDKGYEESKTTDEALAHIDTRLEPFKASFIREVTREDLQRLLEIKMKRILRFNADKAEEDMAALRQRIKEVEHHLAHLTEYAIAWFSMLKEKYGPMYPRRTEIRTFEKIQASKVVEANKKLYVNREEGFIGYGLKKDENVECVSNCSDIDDIIVFFKDGKYKVVKIAEKLYVGKNIMYLAVFQKNDKRTIYNAVYRNGKTGDYYIKRFAVAGVTREKEYDLTQGTAGSKVVYFTANPNGEAETIKVALKPTTRRIKNLVFEKSFSDIAIKGRQSMGNILTKFDIHKIVLKHKGASTLGGSDIWFDHDVLRLNTDKRGTYLGNFDSDDQILVVTTTGEYYTTNFDLNNHYDDDILRMEKFDGRKVWTVVLYDAEQGYVYVKRFQFEPANRRTPFIPAAEGSKVLLITDTRYPQIHVTFGGNDSFREPVDIDADEFIGIKSYKAKGKRLTTYDVADVTEGEPLQKEPEQTGAETSTDENGQREVTVVDGVEIETYRPDDPEQTDGRTNGTDDMTGQMSLF